MSKEFRGILDFGFSVFDRSKSTDLELVHEPLNPREQKTKNKKPKTKNRQRAFTLIEAIVAITLVGIGVTSAMSGLAAIAKADRLLMQREEMQRLAAQKYGEIISTGKIATAELSGDFVEQNIDGYEWNAEVEPSGEENLEILTVTVTPTGISDGPQATVDGLVFTPPVQGGTQ